MANANIALTETTVIPDVFVSGVGVVEELAPSLYRVTYYANQKNVFSGDAERIVVARFIVTLETLIGMSNATIKRSFTPVELGLSNGALN